MGLRKSHKSRCYSGFIRIQKRYNRYTEQSKDMEYARDPEVQIDGQRLNRCLETLESFSGE